MYKLELVYDIDPEDPLAHGPWRTVSFSTRVGNYEDPYKYLKDDAPEGRTLGYRRKLEVGTMFILSCFQHGNVIWGLKGETPSCRWDNAPIAGLLIYEEDPRDLPKTYEAREKIARLTIEAYTKWCNGEVYGYSLTKDGEEIDSCYGYYDKEGIIDALWPYLQHIDGPDDIEITGEASGFMDKSDLIKKELAHV